MVRTLKIRLLLLLPELRLLVLNLRLFHSLGVVLLDITRVLLAPVEYIRELRLVVSLFIKLVRISLLWLSYR